MSGTQQALLAGGGGGAATDPHFASVAILLHGDGTNGTTAFVDSSSHGRTHDAASSSTISTSQSKFGGASISVAASGGAGVRYLDDTEFTLGSADFTFECFVYFNDTGALRYLMGQCASSGANTSSSISVERTAGNRIRSTACSGSSIVVDITGTIAITNNTWYYIAFGRDGNTFRQFVDAVADGTASYSGSINDSSDRLGVGCLGDFLSSPLNGFIDEYRLTTGVYRNIASLGVPAAAFPNS